MTAFGSDFGKFNEYLAKRSYITGFSATVADVVAYDATFKHFNGAVDAAKYPNVARWFNHIQALTLKGGFASSPANAPTVGAATAAADDDDEDDDDDDDLFGDDDSDEEEAERARQAKVSEEQRARQAKKEEASKSLLALEIKPWEAETDLLACLEAIRKIEINGCEWSASHKLIPVAFGIKKLLITATIQDSVCPYTDG